MDGATQLVGLLGWPVRHSASPAMHNAAFAALGLNWAYVPLPVAPERVDEAVSGLRGLGLRGANVTVPHKQAVMSFLDELTPAAQTIGAVNTIFVEEGGRLLGDNTDAAGFAADLAAHRVTVAGSTVTLIGAGGSARAVLYALLEARARRVFVLNRSLDRAQALVDALAHCADDCELVALQFPDDVEACGWADLVVNCTTLGMSPRTEGLPWVEDVHFGPGRVVYDLVYNPATTRLLRMAAEDGAKAIGGLGMLVWQGALAFQLWTGVMPPVDVMRAAAEEVLTSER